MTVDLLRTIWTYSIATIVIVGGMVLLYQAMKWSVESPDKKADQLIVGAIIALMTGAATYVFNEQVAARASARTARATEAGAQSVVAATSSASATPTGGTSE